MPRDHRPRRGPSAGVPAARAGAFHMVSTDHRPDPAPGGAPAIAVTAGAAAALGPAGEGHRDPGSRPAALPAEHGPVFQLDAVLAPRPGTRLMAPLRLGPPAPRPSSTSPAPSRRPPRGPAPATAAAAVDWVGYGLRGEDEPRRPRGRRPPGHSSLLAPLPSERYTLVILALPAASRYRGPLLMGLVCIPLAQLADVAITLLVGDALDQAKDASDAEWMGHVLTWMAVYAVGHSVLRFYQRWLIVVVSRRVEVDLKRELLNKLTSLPFAFHDRSRSGDVVSRLTSDVEAVRMTLGPGLMYTLGAVVIVPISLAILFTIKPALALAMVLPMVGMGVTMKLLTGRLHSFSVAVQESIASISHRAQENFGGIRVVKGYAREDQQARLFEATSAENRDNQVELGKARGLTHAAVNASFDMTFAVILLIGGLAAVDRTLPIGDLFKFIDLTMKVFWPLIAIGWVLGMLPRAIASAERVQELLDEENPIEDGARTSRGRPFAARSPSRTSRSPTSAGPSRRSPASRCAWRPARPSASSVPRARASRR